MPALLPTPPTHALQTALTTLLEDGVASLGLDPLFPGIPVYADTDFDSLTAPYLIVDCTAAPEPWRGGPLWAQPVAIHLVQPVETPDSDTVSLDYDSTPTGQLAYEANLDALILGRHAITGTTYAEQTPATYRTISDFLNSISTADSLDLSILDTRQIHYPGCEGAGLPIRTKQEITTDRSLSFDFFLVATLTE